MNIIQIFEKRFNKKTYIIIYTENFDLFNHSLTQFLVLLPVSK